MPRLRGARRRRARAAATGCPGRRGRSSPRPPRSRRSPLGALAARDVARGDHWHVDRSTSSAVRRVVGAAGVHLLGRARVQGDRLRAGVLEPRAELERTARAVAHAAPQLDRDRHVDRVGTALTIAAASSGCSSSEPPAPVLVTLRTGQPMLMSMMSAPAASDIAAAFATSRGPSRRPGRPSGARRGRCAGSRGCARCRTRARRPRPSRSTPGPRRSGVPGGGTPAPRPRPSGPARRGSGPRRRRSRTASRARRDGCGVRSTARCNPVLRFSRAPLTSLVSVRPGSTFLRRPLVAGPVRGGTVERRTSCSLPRATRSWKRSSRSCRHDQRPRGRRAHPRGPRVRRHQRELRVRRREERAGDARGQDRAARGASARRARDRRRPRSRPTPSLGHAGHAQGPRAHGDKASTRIVGSAEADPLDGQALERVAGRPGADRPQEGRDGRGGRAAGALKLKIVSINARREPEPPLDELPHRFADRTEIAEVRAAHGDLAAGRRLGCPLPAGRARAGPARAWARRAFLDLDDRSGRLQLLASARRARRGALRRGQRHAARRRRRRRGRGDRAAAAASSRCSSTEFQLLAPCERPLPDLHHGLADVEARYRQRYLDLMVNRDVREDVAAARAHDLGDPRATSTARGFVEVETPILQPLYGGAQRAAVHDAPQRARPHAVPAHRDRAVPQAPDRRRARAGLRDRQGLPQRGRLVQAQPRVHDARVVRGLRGLQRRHAPHRGVRRRGVRRRARHDGDHARRPRGRPGAALAAQAARRGDRARPRRRRRWPHARPGRAARGAASSAARPRPRATRPGRSSSTARSRTSSSRTSSSRRS